MYVSFYTVERADRRLDDWTGSFTAAGRERPDCRLQWHHCRIFLFRRSALESGFSYRHDSWGCCYYPGISFADITADTVAVFITGGFVGWVGGSSGKWLYQWTWYLWHWPFFRAISDCYRIIYVFRHAGCCVCTLRGLM